jgi:hypothetical protein
VVAVRPENIELSSTPQRAALFNAVEVTLEQAVYRGVDTFLYLRRSNGKVLIASCRNGTATSLNGSIDRSGLMARWKPESNHVIPAAV